MTDHVYKIIEVTGTSKVSSDDAIANAIKKAAQSVHNLRWFVVTETRGSVEWDKIDRWQVTVKVGFTLD